MNYQQHYLLSLSYDGSSYHGWVKQKNQPLTIQSVFEKSLVKVIKTTDFYIIGASKTDKGVHAIDQKVLLKVNFMINNLSAFQAGVNKALPKDIQLTNVEPVSTDFQLRQVKQKTYCYILNDGTFDVFSQRYQTYVFKQKIDEQQLNKILQVFVGEHDFYLFSGLSEKERTEFKTVRIIDKIQVERQGNQVVVSFQAQGFLRYQIRMIMGAALMCLFQPNRLSLSKIDENLKGIGTKTPFLAPPNGLFLQKIIY